MTLEEYYAEIELFREFLTQDETNIELIRGTNDNNNVNN